LTAANGAAELALIVTKLMVPAYFKITIKLLLVQSKKFVQVKIYETELLKDLVVQHQIRPVTNDKDAEKQTSLSNYRVAQNKPDCSSFQVLVKTLSIAL